MTDNDSMDAADLKAAAELARDLVGSAGELILGMQSTVSARDKGQGRGLVTEADFAAEEILIEGLKRRFPHDAILSEETNPVLSRTAPRVWCIDPLDGTREYADGLPEWAVMMGLLVDGEPAAGAFAIPADGLVFWGWRGGGAFLGDSPLELETISDPSLAIAIHSRNHRSPALVEVLNRLCPKSSLTAGSVGYKVAQILLGKAHLYIHPRGGTMWWDSVAPAAVLLACGGRAGDASGRNFRYEGTHNHAEGLLFTAPGLAEPVRNRLRS